MVDGAIDYGATYAGQRVQVQDATGTGVMLHPPGEAATVYLNFGRLVFGPARGAPRYVQTGSATPQIFDFSQASYAVTLDGTIKEADTGRVIGEKSPAGGIDIVGSPFADTITGTGNISTTSILAGGASDDVISGARGGNYAREIIVGGGGRDTLTGGFGRDLFILDKPDETSPDTITDFQGRFGPNNGADKIGILIRDYGLPAEAAGSPDPTDADQLSLNPEWLVSGSNPVPTAGHGQFLFDETTRELRWDPDGSGNAGSILIATLTRFDLGQAQGGFASGPKPQDFVLLSSSPAESGS